ncbi:salicylate hydroxylase, partial [Mesorhizobium sp. M7A.F.Ca.CA.004.05.1.1]
GYPVRVFEQAQRLEAAGAGIQLSPNATRILRQLGVLDKLLPATVRPEAVVLKEAATLRELARVPLGQAAETRWQAPYLVAHRADLQSALMARVSQIPDIHLTTGARVSSAATGPHGITATAEIDGKTIKAEGFLLIGADGVWSSVRALVDSAKRAALPRN